MIQAKVTVAIIAYYAEFLEECIKSILSQTYQNIKVIVYDDCSPEELEKIVELFDDSRLHYVRNKVNLGAADNCNQALALCDTEYINIFHGDDRMFPWMIDTLVSIMEERPDVDIATSSVYYPLGSGRPLPSISKKTGREYKQKDFIKVICSRSCSISHVDMLFRREFLNCLDIRYRPEVGPAGDLYFSLELALIYGESLLFVVDVPLHEWREHKCSATSNAFKNDKWTESHIYITDLIHQHHIEGQSAALFSHFAKTDLIPKIGDVFTFTHLRLQELRDRRFFLEQKYGWHLSESEFIDVLTIGLLGRSITLLWQKKKSLGAFAKEFVFLKKNDIPLSFRRICVWFLKYIFFRFLSS